MNFINRLAALTRNLFAAPINRVTHHRNYSKKDTGAVSMLGAGMKKKKGGKVAAVIEKKILPVETDPSRLVKFVCGSNILKTGEDVRVLPDGEYPEWLWGLRTGPAPKLEELDPNSKAYWRKVRKLAVKRNNQLISLRRF